MKYKSIRTRLQLFLVSIMILLIISFLFSYISGIQRLKLDEDLLTQQLLLNEIYKDLDKTQYLVQEYIRFGNIEDYRKYTKTYPDLMEKAFLFERFPRTSDITRHTTDFHYQIQTYVEASNLTITYRKNNDLHLAQEYFLKTINLVTLIKNNFQTVFQVIIADMELLREKNSSSSRQNLFLNLLVIGIIVIICLLFMYELFRSIVHPIQALTRAAQQVAEGNIEIPPVPVVSDDELKIMALAFNKMITTIKDQIQELSLKGELEKKLHQEELIIQKKDSIIKETELKALQARINPHFLFNTLNTISQMAFLEEAQKTSALIESMSSMLRYNLENFHKNVSLQDELQNLADYLNIQKLRFEDRMEFIVHSDPILNNFQLPCLILQPLVENSISHGLKDVLTDGLVEVSVAKNENKLTISVKDNGEGISYSRQTEIRKVLVNNVHYEENGIGLYNVYNRLKLFCADQIYFHISSIPGQGTEIRISMSLNPSKDL